MNRSRRAGAHCRSSSLPLSCPPPPSPSLRSLTPPYHAPHRWVEAPQLRCLPATDEAKRAWQGEKDAIAAEVATAPPSVHLVGASSSGASRDARAAWFGQYTRTRDEIAHGRPVYANDADPQRVLWFNGHGLWVVSLRAATPNQAQGALLARDSAVVPTKIASEWAMISDGPIPQFVDSPTIQCMTPQKAAIYYKV